MKIFALVFFSFFYVASYAQDEFRLEKLELITKKFSKVDSLVSFSYECYWPECQFYFFLVKKKKKWIPYICQIEYKSRSKTVSDIKTIKTTKHKISNDSINSVLNLFHQNKLWAFDTDSLNYMGEPKKFRDLKTGRVAVQVMGFPTDGCSETFDILIDEKWRTISIYYPEYQQEKFFVKSRDIFLKLKRRFLDLYKEKRE